MGEGQEVTKDYMNSERRPPWSFKALGLLAFSLGFTPAPLSNEPTLRIWVSEKETGSVHGAFSSVDLLKEMSAKCVAVVLTDDRDKADYRLEAGRAWCCTPHGESRGYKFALFNKDGDAVFSTQTRELKNAVKDMCVAIGRGSQK
jgi:hypothetical protein